MMIKKRTVITLLLLIFTLCLAVGTTLAYLGSVTGEQKNMFTGAENIKARLTEPNWNEKEGMKLVPGKQVRKDPMITNTGEINEYVAIRLTYLAGDETPMIGEDLEKLLNILIIDWNTNWIQCENTDIYYYNKILEPGKVTESIFSSIRVKDESEGLKEADLEWLHNISNFQIKVEGAAIQALGYANATEARESLIALFPTENEP